MLKFCRLKITHYTIPVFSCTLLYAWCTLIVGCSSGAVDPMGYIDSDTVYKQSPVSLYNTATYDKDISLKGLVKEISVLKLKTAQNPNSVVAEPKRIFLLNGKYFIWDKKFAGIKAYDAMGSFLYQIGSIGKGPGEYIRINDVHLIDSTKFVLLCDNSRLQYYTTEGKYLKTVQPGLFATSFQLQDSGRILFYMNNNFNEKSRECNIVLLDSNKVPVKSYFDTKTKEDIPSFDFTGFLHPGFNSLLFSIPYDDKVWTYKNGRFTVAYKFDLGANKLPEDVLQKNLVSKQKYREDAGFIGNNFFETEKFTFFSFRNGKRIDNAILNRQTNTLNTSYTLNADGDYLANIFSVPLGMSGDTLLLGFIPEKISYLQEEQKVFVESLKQKNKMLYDLISTYKPTDNLVILKVVLQ